MELDTTNAGPCGAARVALPVFCETSAKLARNIVMGHVVLIVVVLLVSVGLASDVGWILWRWCRLWCVSPWSSFATSCWMLWCCNRSCCLSP